MTVEERNVALLKRLYDLHASHKGSELAELVAAMADDVRWGSLSCGAPGMEFSRPRTSKAEVIAFFEALGQDWEILSSRAEEFIAQGERVAVLLSGEWRNRRTGKRVSSPKVDIWRIRDGRIVDFFEFYDTARAEAAAVP